MGERHGRKTWEKVIGERHERKSQEKDVGESHKRKRWEKEKHWGKTRESLEISTR